MNSAPRSRAAVACWSTEARSAVVGTWACQRQRGVVVNLAEYAVERRLLAHNPITELSWKAPRTVQTVDRRVVVNPDQARALLDAVTTIKPSGAGLVAFFGAMYYSALRPGEASTLRKSNLALPAAGWGELLLESSTPEVGASWTDSGRRREERQLKHRARGETRVVPAPPAFTALLHAHLESFGTPGFRS
jgi:integrase